MLADLPAAITTDPFHAVMLERIDTGLYYGPLALGATELTMVRPLPSAWEDARHGASKLTTHTSVMETVTAAVAATASTTASCRGSRSTWRKNRSSRRSWCSRSTSCSPSPRSPGRTHSGHDDTYALPHRRLRP